MFEQAMLVGTGSTRKAWTVPVSFAGQLGLAGVLAILPLIYTDQLKIGSLAPNAPITYVPRQEHRGNVAQVVATVIERRQTGFVEPSFVPPHPLMVKDRMLPAPEIAAECTGLCITGDAAGLPQGAVPMAVRGTPLPEPPARKPETTQAAKPAAIPRLTLGGVIVAAKLVSQTKPIYPVMAIRNRVSGAVVLAAVIGTDGRVRELRAVSGHPFLVPAAVEAVRQWVYRPTYLNGNPVEVSTEVTVNFILGER